MSCASRGRRGRGARRERPASGPFGTPLLLVAPGRFFGNPMGMRRYPDAVIETAGLHNAAGFDDGTRAFASIPSRHDVRRRVTRDRLAGMVVTGIEGEDAAAEMAHEFARGAHGLVRKAYGLGRERVARMADRT